MVIAAVDGKRAPERWPGLMNAATAAEYVGERSVDAFRRRIGRIWPKPLKVKGMGERWTRESLDEAIDALGNKPHRVRDVADLL
jgi:hypothetical protein